RDISRLDVPMHDSSCVRGLKRLSNLAAQCDYLWNRQASLLHHGLQRVTFDIFHRQKGLAFIRFPYLVNDTNVWMIKSRCRFSFTSKSLALIGILRNLR